MFYGKKEKKNVQTELQTRSVPNRFLLWGPLRDVAFALHSLTGKRAKLASFHMRQALLAVDNTNIQLIGWASKG